jgi:hypothetical protein
MPATWWRKNRPAAPDLFDQELERAWQQLLGQPQLGQLYETVRDRVIRRLLLPKTEQHVCTLGAILWWRPPPRLDARFDGHRTPSLPSPAGGPQATCPPPSGPGNLEE